MLEEDLCLYYSFSHMVDVKYSSWICTYIFICIIYILKLKGKCV